MGEAKRRQTLDPNYGKSNVLDRACHHVDELGCIAKGSTRLANRLLQARRVRK
jgi:hypothetical protein